MRVLVACEFSGRVREAFRKRGHDAWSCDLLPTEIPGAHYRGDIFEFLRNGPLGEKALLLLISENCKMKKSGRRYAKKCKISPSIIKIVLDSIESLQAAYLK
jgi:hypothetical protein